MVVFAEVNYMCFCKCLFADPHFLPLHIINIFTFLEKELLSLQFHLSEKTEECDEEGQETTTTTVKSGQQHGGILFLPYQCFSKSIITRHPPDSEISLMLLGITHFSSQPLKGIIFFHSLLKKASSSFHPKV